MSAGTATAAGFAWVACSLREFGPVGEKRHLLQRLPDGRGYALTTVCGNSASVQGIWRVNNTKPKCPQCERMEDEIR